MIAVGDVGARPVSDHQYGAQTCASITLIRSFITPGSSSGVAASPAARRMSLARRVVSGALRSRPMILATTGWSSLIEIGLGGRVVVLGDVVEPLDLGRRDCSCSAVPWTWPWAYHARDRADAVRPGSGSRSIVRLFILTGVLQDKAFNTHVAR